MTQPDPAVQKALARKQALQSELEKIDTFLELYKEFSGEATVKAPDTRVSHENGAPQEAPAEKRVRSRGGVGQTDFESITREILLSKKVPLSKEELLDEFHNKGRSLGGANEIGNLKTKIWRAIAESKSLIRIAGAGYWLPDVPCASVGYSPSQNATH